MRRGKLWVGKALVNFKKFGNSPCIAKEIPALDLEYSLVDGTFTLVFYVLFRTQHV